MLAQDLMTSSLRVSSPGVPPAALQNAPVRSAEVGVAQCVADGVDRTVDVAQPVTYRQRRTRQKHKPTRC